MKSTGIIRRVDELGRIVLPMELRRTFNIGEKDEIEIFTENGYIMLKKIEPACVFCGSQHDNSIHLTKNVCSKCISELKKD